MVHIATEGPLGWSALQAARSRVAVAVREQEGRLAIEISDDGAGIDAAKVRARAVERGVIMRGARDREDFPGWWLRLGWV